MRLLGWAHARQCALHCCCGVCCVLCVGGYFPRVGAVRGLALNKKIRAVAACSHTTDKSYYLRGGAAPKLPPTYTPLLACTLILLSLPIDDTGRGEGHQEHQTRKKEHLKRERRGVVVRRCPLPPPPPPSMPPRKPSSWLLLLLVLGGTAAFLLPPPPPSFLGQQGKSSPSLLPLLSWLS